MMRNYDFYKTSIFAIGLTTALAYVFVLMFDHGYFGVFSIEGFTLLRFAIRDSIKNPLLLIMLFPVFLALIIQYKDGHFKRFQSYDIKKMNKANASVILIMLVILAVTYIWFSYLFPVILLLMLIMASYVALHWIGSHLFKHDPS